jgi:redox-sensitive bicupin YhaK (pirin superfamily)
MERIIQREVLEKWPMVYHKNTPIHRAGLALAPGNWKKFDPFLLMAEDLMKKGAFDYHPHRGIETVTYMIDGELNHSDNKGGKGTLIKGETQWLTAGKGLLHLEEAPEDGFAHLLQLWVNLPAASKMVDYRYQDILNNNTPIRTEEGVIIRVFSGNSKNVVSQTQNHVPVTMVEITLKAGFEVAQDLPADYNGFIFILEGSGTFGERKTGGEAKDTLWLTHVKDAQSEIKIHATTDMKLLVIAGKPLREPVAARGPFVMNTEEQLNQAFKDYRDGKFGEWISEKKTKM